MSDLEREVASLATRVLQLETQQIALKKFVAELEFRLDVLTDRFNSRSGETAPANFAQELESLREEIAKLKERVNVAGSGSGSLESAGTFKEQASKNNVGAGSAGDEDSVRLGIERLEEQIRQQSVKPAQDAGSAGDGGVEGDGEEAVEGSQEPAVSAEEFLSRCEKGERDFSGINLAGADFGGKLLYPYSPPVNLSKANLTGANLSNCDLREMDMSGANLRGAALCGAQLYQTNFTEANLNSADLKKAKLMSARFWKAKLRKADLSDAYLERTYLGEANLSGANLSGANLNWANLSGANLSGANLSGAYLRKTKLNEANLSEANR